MIVSFEIGVGSCRGLIRGLIVCFGTTGSFIRGRSSFFLVAEMLAKRIFEAIKRICYIVRIVF